MCLQTAACDVLGAVAILISTGISTAASTALEISERLATKPCTVSWYSEAENGTVTASGRPFKDEALVCAHLSLPFGTRVVLYRGDRQVEVEVIDRGPYISGRDFDLSLAAFDRLGPPSAGVLRCRWRTADTAAQEPGS